MAENSETQTENQNENTETQNEENKDKLLTQDQVNAIVADQRREMQSKIDELNTANQNLTTSSESLTTERDEFKSKAEELEVNNSKLSVAVSKGLPKALIGRLQGSTKEELEADADDLLKLVKTESSFDGGVRESADQKPDMNSLLRRAAGKA